MFEPITYHEKRAILNEVALQQLMGLVQQLIDPTTPKGRMLSQVYSGLTEQYGRTAQILRDKEANRILGGEPEHEDGVTYLSSKDILKYLISNLGRTYFGTLHKTEADDGAIGTPGFGQKFDAWLESLPSLDEELLDIQTGFYADHFTQQGKVIPAFVIRANQLVYVFSFRYYLGVMTLSLDHLPIDYNREAKHHYHLRGEMFSYRGELTQDFFEHEFLKAIRAHKEGYELKIPNLMEVTPDQTTDEAPTSNEETELKERLA